MDLLKIGVSFFIALKMFSYNPPNRMEEKSTYHPKYAYETMDILVQLAEEKYGLRCSGTGGSMPTDVCSLHLDFDTKQTTSIEEYRKLLIDVAEDFLQIINNNRDILPFLREYPFPISRLDLTINYNKLLNDKFNEEITRVTCINGKIRYCKEEPPISKYIEILAEPYEEALAIVKGDSD